MIGGLPPPPRLLFGLWKLLPVGGGSDPAVPSQDMIHIADTKVARRYGDFFIRQIHKFEEVRRSCWAPHGAPQTGLVRGRGRLLG